VASAACQESSAGGGVSSVTTAAVVIGCDDVDQFCWYSSGRISLSLSLSLSLSNSINTFASHQNSELAFATTQRGDYVWGRQIIECLGSPQELLALHLIVHVFLAA
jgi:hypothetical protein